METSGVIDNFITLLAWWSVWTLLDTYLIPSTPWSEVFVLCVAGAMFYAQRVRFQRRVRKLMDGPLPLNGLENVGETIE